MFFLQIIQRLPQSNLISSFRKKDNFKIIKLNVKYNVKCNVYLLN